MKSDSIISTIGILLIYLGASLILFENVWPGIFLFLIAVATYCILNLVSIAVRRHKDGINK
jgi:membrane-bound ClpP family serine protease